MFPKAVRPSAILLTLALLSVANARLKVDFNSRTQDGGPHNQQGWEPYDAGHEVAADFITQSYAAFGATVSVTPSWPNTTDNRVQQMIDRGAGNDGNWNNAAGDLDLVTDFIGIDTRTGNGGNGDWDGTTGTPTYMTLAIGGLPAGDYNWTSFHHDTEHVHGPFSIEISTDGGASFTQLLDGVMTDSTPGGTPDSLATEVGPDAYTLSSTYTMSFTANGTDDVVMRFAPYSGIGVHRQIWGMNGFEIVFPRVASNPTPADGSQVPPTGRVEGGVFMTLSFDPGNDAIAHTAYFSDNLADVEGRVEDVNLGAPPFPDAPSPFDIAYYVGMDDTNLPAFAQEPLQTGITYYWVVDESNGVETFPGIVWSFMIVPEEAWDPTPADDAQYVTSDPVLTLSWQIGSVDTEDRTVSYDVFYGTDEATVATATTPEAHVTTTSLDIGPLTGDTDYYWRVNTLLSDTGPPFATTTVEGDVWHFKTIFSVPEVDPDLVAWWKLDGDIVPGMAFDSSGHANHGTLRGDPEYVSGRIDQALAFDGVDDIVVVNQSSGLPIYNNGTDNAYSVAMWVKGGPQSDRRVFSEGSRSDTNPLFNLGTQNSGTTGQFDVYIRPAGLEHTHSVAEPFDDTWHHIAWVDANGTATLYVDGALDSGDFTYTRAALALNTTSIGGILRAAASHFFTGQIDDVRVYKRSLSEKEVKILAGRLGASNPDPANGATDVARTPTLGWAPGAFVGAVNGNILYYGEDLSAVINRTATDVPLTNPTYPLPITLDLGATFYWVVDTVNGVETWPGDIWSFTTIDWIYIDDMESYTPWTTPGNNIFEIWLDGFGDCAGSGNDTGAVLTENADPVLGGIQSMKYDFDNDGTVFSPCDSAQVGGRLKYSKVEVQIADLPSGIGPDWTIQGVKALSLRFYGSVGNGVEPMWVQLEDTSGYGNKVTYGDYQDEDPNAITEESWHEWFIDLADFEVDLENLVSMVVGFGNEDGSGAHGSGTIYFDDFRLYTPRCMPQRAKHPADFDNSCQVDYPDVQILFDKWLLRDISETPMSGIWTSTDIGDVNVPGSFIDLGGGTYSVTADGADIWGQNDAFHFASQSLSGDGRLTISVDDISGPGTNGWIKAGAMIRETLDANSPNAFMAISGGDGGGETFQWRPEKGADSVSSHTATGIEPPTCIRIVRTGDNFSGFYYRNGEWIQEGDTVTIPMSQSVYIGLAVTSHDINAQNTATFSRTCSDDFVPMDLAPDDLINFADYAELLSNWLIEVNYPQ